MGPELEPAEEPSLQPLSAQALRRRYASRDNIAGYEVMAEPRTDAAAAIVHAFHRDACAVVWAEDAEAACIIGPARYYSASHLNASYLLTGKTKNVVCMPMCGSKPRLSGH